ncbi:hypothetical protein BC827DRAFT_615501 [Russula dissimulans]|nr:hypothetical protein BC827DRAFT_615501 [Russula dissimulans]
MYKKSFARNVSSIEFIMIGVMVFMKRETLSFTKLSHAVELMRDKVRFEKKDVFHNERVSKSLFELMEKMPPHVLRSDGRGDKSAQSTLPPLSSKPPSARPPGSKPDECMRGVGVEDIYGDEESTPWAPIPIDIERSRTVRPQPSSFQDQSNRRRNHSTHPRSSGSDSESGRDVGGRNDVGHNEPVAGGPGGGVSNVNVNISLAEARNRSNA